MNLHETEIHTLSEGDRFSFLPGESTPCQVESTNVIDYYGYGLMLYRMAGSLHGHLYDHTLVWI